jgi:hypothetical protein
VECADKSALSNEPTGRLIKDGGAVPHPNLGKRQSDDRDKLSKFSESVAVRKSLRDGRFWVRCGFC